MLTRLTSIAATKSGPEMAMTAVNWPHLVDSNLVDVTDIATELMGDFTSVPRGSIPVALTYSFVVEYDIARLTAGSVKTERHGAPTWPPSPQNVRHAPATPWRASITPQPTAAAGVSLTRCRFRP